MSLRDKCQRLSALPSQERGVVVRALFLLPLVSMSLRLIGFRRTDFLLSRLPVPRATSKQPPETQLRHAERVAGLVRAAVRNGISAANCLDESLVLSWLLRRQGIEADLRIGVCKENGKFEAHAWVVFDGVTLNETDVPHERFAAFDAIPSHRAGPQ